MMNYLFRGVAQAFRKPTVSFSPVKYNLQPIREMASLKHKKIIKQAKGFRGRANRVFSVAFHRVLKAKQYAYRDRKVRILQRI